MARKFHHPPISGGDRKALSKALSKSRAMTHIFAERSAEKRREGEALIREADNLLCQLWNEKIWSDGGPIDPSPTVKRAVNGGFPWLLIACSRCKARYRSRRPATCEHNLRPRSHEPVSCSKCKGVGKRPPATLLQLMPRQRNVSNERP